MESTAPKLPSIAKYDVSVADIYMVIQSMHREITALRGQLDELKATQKRLVDSNLNKLYRPKEIAALINVHHYTVLDWIKQDRLIPTEGTKVSGWELERFLQESTKYHDITGV